MAFVDFLITPDWLKPRLGNSAVKTLDCTWIMPGTDPDLPSGYIPGAQFFDIDDIAAPHPSLKHMLPSAVQFEAAMDVMGISRVDHVICYDRFGVKSAPRLWWTFRMFGHEKISILDGGLPAWIKSGHDVSAITSTPKPSQGYKASAPLIGVISEDEIIDLLSDKPQIIDARSKGRFDGTEPEPRKNLKSGHIPGSLSLPYMDLVDGGVLRPVIDLSVAVQKAGINLDKPIITTCGSGVTASGLAFIFTLLGATDIRVYDGSWSEWGASDTPIEI